MKERMSEVENVRGWVTEAKKIIFTQTTVCFALFVGVVQRMQTYHQIAIRH